MGQHRMNDMTNYSVDLNDISSREELHKRLAQIFSFPGYYGRNWDAFNDCIAGVGLPMSVVVSGFGALQTILPREAQKLADCLRWAAENARPGEIEIIGLP
jgi:ribonuclease inhibitor